MFLSHPPLDVRVRLVYRSRHPVQESLNFSSLEFAYEFVATRFFVSLDGICYRNDSNDPTDNGFLSLSVLSTLVSTSL